MPAATAKKPKTKINKETKIKKVKDRVKKQVLEALGKPENLWRIDVKLYNFGRARVNIWQEQTQEPKQNGLFASPSDIMVKRVITDSHYLWLSKTATIKEASPPITKKYHG